MFFITAHSQDQSPRVVPLGGHTTFYCSIDDEIQQFNWLVNGTRLEDLDQTDEIETGVIFNNIRTLLVNISEKYNNTNIQCIVNSTLGEIIILENDTLLVQGSLSAVGSLNFTLIPLDSIISLTWTPPFSLDITNIDHDIKYCVGVTNSISSLVIHSKCGITDTQYNYTVSPCAADDTNTFTITAVNEVGNGTSDNVTVLSSIMEAPQLVEDGNLRNVVMKNNSFLYYLEESSAPVCSYNLDLYDIHDPTHKYNMMDHIPTNQNGLRIQILINNDESNRLFSGKVSLINSFGTTTSAINISTYDVQDTTFDFQDELATCIVAYIHDTEALGALLALMYLDEDGNIVCNQSIYAAKKRSEDNFTLPMDDLAISNTYMGLAYDIEGNGLGDKAYPAVRLEDPIKRGMMLGSSANSSCTVIYDEGDISVSCVDLTSSGYRVILLPVNDKYNQLTVVNVTSGEQQTMPVVSSGRYCILELPGEKFDSEVQYFREFIAEEVSSSSSTSTIVTSVVVVAVVVIVVITGLIVVLKSRRAKQTREIQHEFEHVPHTKKDSKAEPLLEIKSTSPSQPSPPPEQ